VKKQKPCAFVPLQKKLSVAKIAKPISSSNVAVNAAAASSGMTSIPIAPSSGSSRRTKVNTLLEDIWPRSATVAIILGGGESDRRLFPLTEKRALPALPVGGNYRLIDIPMSNCIQSGINKIYVLTQFNSQSLNKYITRTYTNAGSVPYGGDGFVEVLATTQYPHGHRWTEGGADAVRQMSWLVDHTTNPRALKASKILILPADQIYRADFAQLVMDYNRHESEVDSALSGVTVVLHPVPLESAPRFGVAKTDGKGIMTSYVEKPTPAQAASLVLTPEEVLQLKKADRKGQLSWLDPEKGKYVLASTGIYLFDRELLVQLLKDNPQAHGFGGDIIPLAIASGRKVRTWLVKGYWSDVGGSIKGFLDANLELLREENESPFDAQAFSRPFFQGETALPALELRGCTVSNCSLSPGGCIINSTLSYAVVGPRAFIGSGCVVEDSVVMGADYYDSDRRKRNDGAAAEDGPIQMGLGTNCRIKRAIIDKNACIGNNVQLVNKEGVWESFDRMATGVCVRQGVVVVTKNATVAHGTII